MTTTPDLPNRSETGSDHLDDAMFDDLAARAGAALRRPAPEDGVRVIAARRRRQQIGKVIVVGGIAAAALVGVLVSASSRDDGLRPPVDSTPDTLPATTVDFTPDTRPATTIDSVPKTVPSPTSTPADPSISTAQTPTTGTGSLWADLEPGATAPLPPAPIPARNSAALVWTGTELIVWGGLADELAAPSSQEGAAFDPVAGTWRLIALPPDAVRPGVVVWTGTEMAVWGDGAPGTASAAYNPATDTWRTIADPPTPGSAAFWTGDEAILLGEPDNGGSFAYEPATDEWRRIADGPWSLPAVWTGTTIVTVTDTDSVTGTRLSSYDPATNTWRELEGVAAGEQPVVVPGRGGAPATVALLPGDPGTPIELLDDRGNAIGEWAGRPAELAVTCSKPPENSGCLFTSFDAESVGGEVLFWYSGSGWAFDVETQTWSTFPLDGRRPEDGTEVMAVGDLLFAWGAGRDGLVYRAARAA